jgi:hypothetical protein
MRQGLHLDGELTVFVAHNSLQKVALPGPPSVVRSREEVRDRPAYEKVSASTVAVDAVCPGRVEPPMA